MRKFLSLVDGLLRGTYTRREDLRRGDISLPAKSLTLAASGLGVLYGFCVGLYGLTQGSSPSFAQCLASMAKIPLLFLLTLAVTLPALYVFGSLRGAKLGGLSTLRLLLATVTVNLAVLASLGPILAFFTFSTKSYAFMVLVNTAFCAFSGKVALGFLGRALDAVFALEIAPTSSPPSAPPSSSPSSSQSPSSDARPAADSSAYRWLAADDQGSAEVAHYRPLPRPTARAAAPGSGVYRIWTLLFAVVGAQMAWILRPFIGAPGLPFTFFRPRESNFFEAVLHAFGQLFR